MYNWCGYFVRLVLFRLFKCTLTEGHGPITHTGKGHTSNVLIRAIDNEEMIRNEIQILIRNGIDRFDIILFPEGAGGNMGNNTCSLSWYIVTLQVTVRMLLVLLLARASRYCCKEYIELLLCASVVAWVLTFLLYLASLSHDNVHEFVTRITAP